MCCRKIRVDRKNENGGFVSGKGVDEHFSKHKMVHRYKLSRRDESGEKSITDFVAVDERWRKYVLDAKIMRVMYEWSHHAWVAKMKNGMNDNGDKVSIIKWLDRKE